VLCRAAQFVFFSRNRFVVHDYRMMPFWTLPPIQHAPVTPDTASTEECYPFDRFAASQFLRDAVPIHCLADLRSLELVFPPYEPHGWPLDQHPAMADWRATVHWLHNHITAPALAIRVAFPDFIYGISDVVGRLEVSKEHGMLIVDGYKRIVHPLRDLVKDDGLAGFYVEAAYPWRWVRNTILFMRLVGNEGWLERTELELKEDLQEVPGRDTNNKPEPEKSIWQRWYDVTIY
jgi:hypothetical protein